MTCAVGRPVPSGPPAVAVGGPAPRAAAGARWNHRGVILACAPRGAGPDGCHGGDV